MRLSDINLQQPQFLWLAAVGVPVVILLSFFSRAEQHHLGNIISTCLRSTIITLLSIALSRPELRRDLVETVQPKTCILLDQSRSTQADQQGIDSIADSLKARLSDVSYTTGSFAGDVVRSGQEPAHKNATDLEAAIQAGVGWSQTKCAGRVVLVTDANATRGDAVAAAQRAASSGARVIVIPVGKKITRGPRIRDIEPANNIHVGVTFPVSVTIDSDTARRVRLELTDSSGKAIESRPMLVEGAQTTTVRLTASQPGVQEWTLRVIDESDPLSSRLAEARSFPVFASGPPKLLICDQMPTEVAALIRALMPLNLQVESCTPQTLPADLGQYAALVLSDLNGREFTAEQQKSIREFTESNGGGLVFVGGKNVNATRWQKNDLSELLPVTLKEKPAKVLAKVPDISVCFVLDRSGSMNEALGVAGGRPVRKIDMVKAAVRACVQALPDTARICVIVFDSQADVAVDPMPVSQRDRINEKVNAIELGGGTAMAPGLDAGMRILTKMDGAKYLIVLTDGQSVDPPLGMPWEQFADRARAAGVSWTSIAVGQDADQDLLSGMANRAGGKYTFCGDASELPKVFIDEAKAIKRVADTQDEPVLPRRGPASFALRGRWQDSMPTLAGANSADAKAGADIELIAGSREPVLASWQFGAGRVCAFLSDAKTTWAGKWLLWNEFSAAWIEIVQLVLRSPSDLDLQIHKRADDDAVTMAFDVKDSSGDPVPDAQVEVIAQGESHSTATTRRPGQYFTVLPRPKDTDTLRVHAIVRRGRTSEAHYVTDVSFRESMEDLLTGANMNSAESIALSGNGICTTDLDAVASICHERLERKFQEFQPFWPWLVIASILCWPLDVLFRKLL